MQIGRLYLKKIVEGHLHESDKRAQLKELPGGQTKSGKGVLNGAFLKHTANKNV